MFPRLQNTLQAQNSFDKYLFAPQIKFELVSVQKCCNCCNSRVYPQILWRRTQNVYQSLDILMMSSWISSANPMSNLPSEESILQVTACKIKQLHSKSSKENVSLVENLTDTLMQCNTIIKFIIMSHWLTIQRMGYHTLLLCYLTVVRVGLWYLLMVLHELSRLPPSALWVWNWQIHYRNIIETVLQWSLYCTDIRV